MIFLVEIIRYKNNTRIGTYLSLKSNEYYISINIENWSALKIINAHNNNLSIHNMTVLILIYFYLNYILYCNRLLVKLNNSL